MPKPNPRRLRLLLLLIAGPLHAFAQQQVPASALAQNQVQLQEPPQSQSPSEALAADRGALTAAQIDDLLQQRPELVVDIKQLVADQSQLQGVGTQADSITDEQLFAQISASRDLRSSITNWLKSRGYVSQADLSRNSLDDRPSSTVRLPFADTENNMALQSGTRSTSQADNAELLDRLSGHTTDASQESRLIRSPTTTLPVAPEPKPANITDLPQVLRRPAPYNLNSLRDLYTQIPQGASTLKRFGSDVFADRNTSPLARSGMGQGDTPLDLPVGPDYVLGSGDSLVINLWGGVSQTFQRTIDREGKLVLPEAGTLDLSGKTLQQAQAAITAALKLQFHNAQVDISLARLRTVRVYVVGDVQRPGAYDVSSLSTSLNALYAAGGPTGIGSLRVLRHYRGNRLVSEVDLYDFLLHGLRSNSERLEGGDTLLIPPAGAQVALFGAVKRPAIYELKTDESLETLLEDAGGATVAAALNHITIERIQPNRQRETITLDAAPGASPQTRVDQIKTFRVQDGDRIQIAPILPYSECLVYVEGHVARPGKLAFREGMLLRDVIQSYQDLLPEPSTRGDLIRLVPPDLHPETIQFDLADLLIGNSSLALQPFDTIRIYGRYEVDAPQVTIRGEVLRPGTYALTTDMTAAQLVKMAGGLKRDALLESADLTSYTVERDQRVNSQRSSIDIGAAMRSGSRSDVPLKAGDILTIRQISGWADIGASVILNGEVTYPGSYGLQEGEHLSSVLRRASGFRNTAYPDGAVLVREQVKELETKTRDELIRQIETTSVAARIGTVLSPQDETTALASATQQQNELLQRLKSQPATGRLVVRIGPDINNWAGTPADIELRAGDRITIPKRPGFVLVSGQVYNASAITFVPGKTAGWYLQHAGGANDSANKKEIFVVQADGSVVGRQSGSLFSSVLSMHLQPGDVVVVPQKIVGGSLAWRNLLTVAQITSSIAITAAVAGLF